MRRLLIGTALVSTLLASVAGADQNRMRGAMDELRQARALLEDAPDDKGGHRMRAIELIDKAIGEVRAGIEFAEGQ
jgi:hypothetical protein